MKIPFDIKYRPQIESGEYKVETEAGSPAKVMDWEYNNRVCGKCIAIKITEGDGDHGLLYTHEGKRASIFQAEEGSDLFIITPEPELSEFENKLRVICEDAVRESQLFPERTSEDFAKKHSAELLDLARKELSRQGSIVLPIEDFEKHYVEAQEKGRKEALKDLPRWRRGLPPGTISLDVSSYDFICVNNKLLELSSLVKFPGFNE